MTRLDVEIQGDGWLQAHEALVRLAASRAGLDFEEGQRLRAALLAQAHVPLGYGSFVEYIERLFGYSPRLTYEKLRVAEAIEQLDGIAAALGGGQLSWSVVRELTRVATPETEGDWLRCAAGLTARQVQERVSGHRPGAGQKIRRTIALDVTSSGSRFRARFLPLFATQWPTFAATQADRSTTTRPCSCWLDRRWADQRTQAVPVTRWR